MRYTTPGAFRAALERRLLSRSLESGVSLDRLRRRVLLERLLARLVVAQPGCWVLKGGMALEVRLGDRARLTKDIDLGLRDDAVEVPALHDRLMASVAASAGDHFELRVDRPALMAADGGGHPTWRTAVDARLAGKPFGRVQLDISPRRHELTATDVVTLSGLLDFAGLPAPAVEVVDVHRHAAEKLHAMLRDFGDRENTRVRDLVDVVTLIEYGLLDPTRVAHAARDVWAERNASAPPEQPGPLPTGWQDRYPRLVSEQAVDATTLPAAAALVDRLWHEMFDKES